MGWFRDTTNNFRRNIVLRKSAGGTGRVLLHLVRRGTLGVRGGGAEAASETQNTDVLYMSQEPCADACFFWSVGPAQKGRPLAGQEARGGD